MDPKEKAKIEKILHRPEDMGPMHLEYARQFLEKEGLPWPIECLNREKTLPLRPGMMTTVLGRPGHGKSTLLGLVGRHHARILRDAGLGLDHAVVHVTWEQSVEELETFYEIGGEHSISDVVWGRVPIDVLEKRSKMRQYLPVWMIGLSVTKREKDTPRMFLNTVLEAIEMMESEYSVKPALLLMDYLQIVPIPGYSSRVEQVTEAAPRIKEVATRVGAPALVAVQASREVDGRDYKVPQQRDSQWGSSIEQASDQMFGLWRPVLTDKGGTITVLEKAIDVTENLFVMERLKQRGEVANHTWLLNFDPSTLTITERATGINGDPPGWRK